MKHVLYDCSTGNTHEMTREEAIAHPHVAIDGHEAEVFVAQQKAQADAQKQRDSDIAAIKAGPTHPDFAAALVRHLGLG